jgi:hypothetical protein
VSGEGRALTWIVPPRSGRSVTTMTRPEGSVVDATSRTAPPPARRAERTARTPYIVPVRTLERRLPDHWPASCVVVVSWPTVNAKGA